VSEKSKPAKPSLSERIKLTPERDLLAEIEHGARLDREDEERRRRERDAQLRREAVSTALDAVRPLSIMTPEGAKAAAKTRLRAEREARAELDEEAAGVDKLPAIRSLADIVAAPGSRPVGRIRGILDVGGSMTIVAMRKTGKTTLVANLIRSLVTGEPWLDRFEIERYAKRILVLNFEMTEAMFSSWLVEIGLHSWGDAVFAWNLRGHSNPLRSLAGRELLIERLAELDPDVVIVDTFSRAFVGSSQNDNGDVGRFLDLLRELVGPSRDLVVTVHAGWSGERSRGASALEDWPDTIVTLSRDREDPEDATRFLSIEGRSEIDIDEIELGFDVDSRRLYVEPLGVSKAELRRIKKAVKADAKAGAKAERTEEKLAALVELVKASAGAGELLSASKAAASLKLSNTAGGELVGLAIERKLIERFDPPGKSWQALRLIGDEASAGAGEGNEE
jgi:hypothetical protein